MDLQSCREDNEMMLKAQEDQNQLNAAILQSLTDIQGQIKSGHQTTNPKRSKSSTRGDSCKRSHVSWRDSRDRVNTLEWPTSGSYDSEKPSGDSSSPSHRNKRRRHFENNSRDEFKKERPPTFNGEVKTGQEAEAWLLRTRKYFQVQDYSKNMKERVAIFNLTGSASIWWEHHRQVKKVNERRIVWKQFKK